MKEILYLIVKTNITIGFLGVILASFSGLEILAYAIWTATALFIGSTLILSFVYSCIYKNIIFPFLENDEFNSFYFYILIFIGILSYDITLFLLRQEPLIVSFFSNKPENSRATSAVIIIIILIFYGIFFYQKRIQYQKAKHTNLED
jgi:uncharacterized membrane protein